MNARTSVALEDLLAQGKCAENVALGPMTTYKLGGEAAYFCEPEDVDELSAAFGAAQRAGIDVLVIGRGSNIVVSDQGFDGVVIRPGGEFGTIEIANDGTVNAGAAVPLPRLARATVSAGRGGLEWCIGIPGSVGGAVRMNAGGHGSDIAAWLLTASVLDVNTGATSQADAAGLDLSYRHSNLTHSHVVVAASFRTIGRDPEVGNRMLREVTQWRREHQPGGTLNAGSVFKNPPGDSAGRLIDSLGLKAFRIGGAAVSERHANFFEAGATATAQDLHDLVAAVRHMVGEATGIWLEPEVRFVGEFDKTQPGGEAGWAT
jgi:UDP-N-acetylmuramate dehydrogenase